MERDLALLRQSNADGCPILRLYSWSVPTISLGRLQVAEEVLEMERVREHGIVVVQRPTGGRGVLHWGDFTYSFIVPSSLQETLGSSVSEVYLALAVALQESLRILGVETMLSTEATSRQEVRSMRKQPCFITPTKSELLVGKKKLIGSAQLRQKEGVIQHGSMPISNEYQRLPEYERCSPSIRQKRIQLLQEHATGLAASSTKHLSFTEISDAFIAGFESMLGERFS